MKYYTVAEVAEMLKLTPSHVYKLVNNGQLSAVRLGRFIRIPENKIPGMEDDATSNATRP
jgi:excisionase family DNA binding protein